MPTFAYQARDEKGATKKGSVEASDQAAAAAALSQKGLVVISISESASFQRKHAGRVGGRKIGAIPEPDMVMFTRQLATMIDAGLPLVQSLSALTEQTNNKNFKPVLQELTATIETGEQLSSSLAKYPTVFDRLYVNMVRAGESGGALAEILDRLASYQEASSKLKKKVKSSMSYPVIVMSMAVLIVIFLMVKVIPVFEGIFNDMGVPLPAPTRILINVSKTIRSPMGIVVGFGIFGMIIAFKKWIKTEPGRKKWDHWKLKFPVFGPLLQKIAVSRFARTFAQLIRSGVPIIETLNIVASSSGNWLIESATMDAAKAIEKGENIGPSLAKHPIFPPMIIRMITAGESTGKVDVMLVKISDFYDSEIEAMLSGLTSLIEPLLIGFLGVVIGGIVLAMFMPMFKMHEVINK
ncbi:MAG: type II secretion system F family protein [Verrucomicrobia bacterium]|nr:type II secretion system F family protein [Verrucomicrobiota bacterium]